MKRYIEYLKEIHIIVYAVLFFAVLAISEQVYNGLWGSKFVIKDLTDIFTYVFSQLSVKHGFDSWVATTQISGGKGDPTSC